MFVTYKGPITAMKRDFDLIRKLLIYFEKKEGPELVRVPTIEGYNELVIKYHLVLLYDAGFLRCETEKSTTSDRVIQVLPFDLTWDGHEFLDKIKNETIWNKVKDTIVQKGLSTSLLVINKLAAKFTVDLINHIK
jgi:hypothetical protein